MAFLECRFFSEALGVSVTANVLLPQQTSSQIGLKGVADSDGAPMLYLLHGLSDDESIWLRRTSIERYATQYGLAVIMPDGGRSYYADMFHGGKYWTYLSEELPRVMQSFFRFSTKREDTFAAGLSMGGYGAMKLALHCPEKFAAAAVLSASPREMAWMKEHDERMYERRALSARINHGSVEAYEASYENAWRLIDEHAHDQNLPRLYFTCGIEDGGYPAFKRFQEHAEAIGLNAVR